MRKRHRTMHVGYTKVYLDILQHDEVLDIDIRKIHQVYLEVLSKERKNRDLNLPPLPSVISELVERILYKLKV